MRSQTVSHGGHRSTHASAVATGGAPRWADLLRRLRVASGLAQPVWAHHMGVSRATVQRWESGELIPSAEAEAALLRFGEQHGTFTRLGLDAAVLREELTQARARSAPTRPTRLPERPQLVPKFADVPAALTTFIGRTRELDDLQRLVLGGAARLITLIGPGGIGKTRLAFELARTWRRRVAVVDLTPLRDPELVLPTLASAVDARDVPGQSLALTIAERLRTRRTLLVLDNCEHLRGACASLAVELLSACAELVIMATSREPLAVPGELLYRLSALSLPASDVDAENSDAVRLFVDRAAAHRSGVDFGSQMTAVAQICARVDGLPLAIELAAARVRVLTPAQIAERLDDRLSLLAASNLAVAPRQRTLRAALDWSHDLLSEPERSLFRRLAVLAGPFELDAAEHVGAGPDLPRERVLDVLAALVDRSLVAADVTGGVARYRLLETIREYAVDHLQAAGELDITRRALLGWVAELAFRAEPELRGPDQAVWLNRLDAAIEHVRSALAWALGPDRPASERHQAASVAVALSWFWYARGRATEGRDWYGRCLAHTDGDLPPELRARVLEAAGTLAHQQADYAAATDLLRQSLAIWRELNEARGIQTSASLLGVIAKAQGQFPEAEALLSEALELARALGDTRRVATILNNLASVAIDQEAYARAEVLFQESLTLKRTLGEPAAIAATLLNLGDVAMHQAAYERARSLLDESLALFTSLGHQQGMAVALHNLGRIAVRQHDLAGAARHLDMSGQLFRDIDDRLGLALTAEGMAELAVARGDGERAVVLLAAAEAWRAQNASPLPHNERAHHARVVATATAKLGSAGFRAAHAAGSALSLEQVLASGSGGGPAEVSPLSPREREVARLIANGLSNREIGSVLVIAESTAERHVANILRKLGARSRAQVGAWVAGQAAT